MKNVIIILAVILGSLLMQSCLCDCWLFDDYGYGAPPPPPPPPHHRGRVVVW